ncbi:MAG: hypothetical protein JEZ07_16920 [Phycisphaerae bacterium]|nr:hypothetical protein [Phycisphaerae bacterium]
MFDRSKGNLSLNQYIKSIDSFFGLWRLDDEFRNNIMMYIATKERIRRFLDNHELNEEVQEAFEKILAELENISLIAGATTDDSAYVDHLLIAEKYWKKIRPEKLPEEDSEK